MEMLHSALSGTLGWNETSNVFTAHGNGELCRMVGVRTKLALVTKSGLASATPGVMGITPAEFHNEIDALAADRGAEGFVKLNETK